MVEFKEKLFEPNEIGSILNELNLFSKVQSSNRKGLEYYVVPCAFDIETSSFENNGEKQATMYVWQFAIDGYIIVGRTWNEFIEMMNYISKKLMLWEKRRLIVYVHNLAFEFSFVKHWFKWSEVFNMESNKPLFGVSHDGFEFRCSYLLSGSSLETVGNNLIDSNIKKKTGYLDYAKKRHSLTPLTEEELEYCINDVKIMILYIQEQIDLYKSMFSIPYTNTGRVRSYVREKCLSNKKYKALMKALTLDVVEYEQLKRAFQGGFTHANASYVERVIDDVASYDFTSSYPAVMCSEAFPMSKATLIEKPTKSEFESYLKTHCCLFDVMLSNVTPKYDEQIISVSRCQYKKNVIENNGRVVYADQLVMSITDVDFQNYKNFYNFDYKVSNLRIYKKGYLPKEIIECVLELYEKKTTLKGVKNKVQEYLIAKGMLNSIYGMMVTDVCREIIEYVCDSGEFKVNDDVTPESQIKDYNENPKRFLFYPWGVWVTAYARRNLFTGILTCMKDYLYSDTDSLKIMNHLKYQEYFRGFNEMITSKIKNVLGFYNIDVNRMNPKTIKGVEKPLGVWDFEGVYKRFKTLGSKRYLVEKDDNEIELTVSGLNKEKFKTMVQEKNIDPFEFFKDGFIVDSEHSGKHVHVYINNEMSGTLTDYMGVTHTYYEKSGMWMGESEYNMRIGKVFAEYLLGIRTERW